VFVFIGDGTGREALQASAAARGLDNVRFIPYQPREHLRWTYATASVFIVSLKPGLGGYIVPSKLYGILASGRPYIAAVEDDSEVADITRRHECGIKIAPGDARAMAQALLALRADPARREAMGVRARHAATNFDRRRQIAAHATILRQVASAEFAEKRRARRARFGGCMKRAFDFTLALAGLMGSAPLWVAIAVAIKLQDGGPVLLGQERVGRGGRVFRAWKFRSMIPDAERHTGPVQAVADDPRITSVGRWLRARALDELPQLWNILCGDMSFVGPRPLRPAERDTTGGESLALETIPGYDERHRVRPGLTGLAQVYAARDATRPHKFALDCEYVATHSFVLDLELIARSVWITCCGAWEAVESSRSARSARV
jgi:lipopolysaccharide/colanic/teichoic acid biosynthesis glycosyltransferase